MVETGHLYNDQGSYIIIKIIVRVIRNSDSDVDDHGLTHAPSMCDDDVLRGLTYVGSM